MNYCQDGLQVYFATETQQYTEEPIYGYYELQPNEVNGKPYFKSTSSSFGIWWGINYWIISDIIYVGQELGYAFFGKDVYCPNQLSELGEWLIWDGNTWYYSANDIVITCEYIFVQTNCK